MRLRPADTPFLAVKKPVFQESRHMRIPEIGWPSTVNSIIADPDRAFLAGFQEGASDCTYWEGRDGEAALAIRFLSNRLKS